MTVASPRAKRSSNDPPQTLRPYPHFEIRNDLPRCSSPAPSPACNRAQVRSPKPHLHAPKLAAVAHRPRILLFGSATAADCVPTLRPPRLALRVLGHQSPRRRRILFRESRQRRHACPAAAPSVASETARQFASFAIRTSRPSAADQILIQWPPIQPCRVRILHQPSLRRNAPRNSCAYTSRQPRLLLQSSNQPDHRINRALIVVSWSINAVPRQFLVHRYRSPGPRSSSRPDRYRFASAVLHRLLATLLLLSLISRRSLHAPQHYQNHIPNDRLLHFS